MQRDWNRGDHVYLSNLKLRNWKNFRSAEVALTPRTFLIGPNASGKSNFLDSLRFLRDVSAQGLAAAVEKRGGVSALRCLSSRGPSDIGFATVITDTSGKALWGYELSINQDSVKRPVIKTERAIHLPNEEVKLNRPDSEDEHDPLRRTQTALEQIIANVEFRPVAEFFRDIEYQHIIPQAVRDPQDFSGRQVHNDPFGRDFVMRMWNTPVGTRTAWLKRILKVLRVAVPQLSDLDVTFDDPSTGPHIVVRYEHWRPYPARQTEAQLSDGTLRLLGLLWAMFEGEGPLLLEEPELSLHSDLVRHIPDLLENLQREIRSMRRKTGGGHRQIVISTHSRELLDNQSISAKEVIRLEPTHEGTHVLGPSGEDMEAVEHGLTVADILLPKAAPKHAGQLLLPFS
jgi:predicted ATPase